MKSKLQKQGALYKTKTSKNSDIKPQKIPLKNKGSTLLLMQNLAAEPCYSTARKTMKYRAHITHQHRLQVERTAGLRGSEFFSVFVTT